MCAPRTAIAKDPPAPESIKKERSGTFHPISLVDWLRFFVNTTYAWTKLPDYCSNPVNYQTHILAAPASGDHHADFVFPQGRFLVPAHVIDRVHSLVQTAFFVGITEYYAASLCLFRWSVTGQLPSSGCAATGGIETTHKDYGNAAGTRGLSAEELSLIAQVSRVDELVYGFGLDRLYRDARKAKFTLFRRA